MIIIGREITISALREWMAQLGRRNNVAVAKLANSKPLHKWPPSCCCSLVLENFHGLNFILIGNILMGVAVILTVWSMCYYLKVAFADFKE
jgi:cardiolipin synthase